MSLCGASIIGFGRGSVGARRFRAYNPAMGRELDRDFFSASAEDVDRAAQLASAAFAIYGRFAARQRAELLRSIAAKLEEVARGIVETANLETALPVPRLQSELARTCFQLRFQATIVDEGSWVDARIDHGDPHRKPVPKPDVRSMMRPLGPVVVFGASNFPLAFSVAGGDTASALAAGNTIIFKAHPAHPGTSEIFGLAMQEVLRGADLPEGIFSLLFDDGIDVGTALVKHPLIKAVGFTGSRAGGCALTALAASRPEPVPVYAEMSSINPVFLLPGALEERGDQIASGIHASVTLGVGQFCTNPGLIFAGDGPALQKLTQRLASLMTDTAEAPMLTEGIWRNYQHGVERLTKAKGVKLLTRRAEDSRPWGGGAALFAAAGRSYLSDPSLMDEVFGPSTLVIACGDREEMLSAARSLEGQLTACIHGSDADLAASRDLIAILEHKAGRLIFNGFPTGVEVCHAMVHGGPFPATSDGRSTSVGGRAITRFSRPICYQDYPDAALPDELKETNPLGLWRTVDGEFGRH